MRFLRSQGNRSRGQPFPSKGSPGVPPPQLMETCSNRLQPCSEVLVLSQVTKRFQISSAMSLLLRYRSTGRRKMLNVQETSAIIGCLLYFAGERPARLFSRSGGMVDAPVSKTGGSNPVSVRVRPSAPLSNRLGSRVRSKWTGRPKKGRLFCLSLFLPGSRTYSFRRVSPRTL